MIALGTIINTCGVIIGGISRLLFSSKIKQRYQDTLMNATGICVLFLGIIGTLEKILTVSNDTLVSGNTMMIIGSLAIGALVGEFLNIEYHFENFGEWLKQITKSNNDNNFIDGFVTTSLTICIGAMAVVGALQDGLIGETSTLETKAVLDAIIVMIMSATKGKGCIFAAIPLFIFQGSITLLSSFIEPIMTPLAFNNLSIVGSILIFCVGINLIWENKIKTANLLPAVIVSVICAYIM